MGDSWGRREDRFSGPGWPIVTKFNLILLASLSSPLVSPARRPGQALPGGPWGGKSQPGDRSWPAGRALLAWPAPGAVSQPGRRIHYANSVSGWASILVSPDQVCYIGSLAGLESSLIWPRVCYTGSPDFYHAPFKINNTVPTQLKKSI